jgi:hypothetical protein
MVLDYVDGMEDVMPMAPLLIRILRVSRILRLVRTLRWAKNIRKQLIVMMYSAPALLNIATLLFLVMFIFAVVGMSFFKYVKHNGAVDNFVNMETFPNALLLLFRLCTSAGWNDVTDGFSIADPHCNKDAYVDTHDDSARGDCGSASIAQIYFFLYILLSNIIMVNMYIAVLLDNMVEVIVHSALQQGIPAHAFDDFYVCWSKFDPLATQFISHSQLKNLLEMVPKPLGFQGEECTSADIGDLAIPLYVADAGNMFEPPKAHCADILDMLVQRYHHVDTFDFDNACELKALMYDKLNTKFPNRKEFGHIQGDTNAYYKMHKSTLVIQKAWRKRNHTEKPMEHMVLADHQPKPPQPLQYAQQFGRSRVDSRTLGRLSTAGTLLPTDDAQHANGPMFVPHIESMGPVMPTGGKVATLPLLRSSSSRKSKSTTIVPTGSKVATLPSKSSNSSSKVNPKLTGKSSSRQTSDRAVRKSKSLV